MPNTYRLLPALEYVDDMIASINQATTRVDMIALTLSEDDTTRDLIDAICRASERGVKVSIGFDIYYTYREIEKTSRKIAAVPKRLKLMLETKKRLERSGAKVRWLGLSSFTFLLRRTHTKWSVVDDVVYSFGGVNLYHDGINNIDYMFRVDNKVLAEEIHHEHRRIMKADKTARDYRSHLFGSAQHTVLIDGGRMFDSIIYRHALSYAQEATSIVFVSQYCPTGRLGRELSRHNDCTFYFNPWQNADDILNRWLIRISSWLTGIKTSYTKRQYLHAKFMLFTMPTGQKIAISGSHNFVSAGGMLGTREVALETTDPDIIDQLESFLDNHIKV